MAKLFGYRFELKKDKEEQNIKSVVPPNDDESSINVSALSPFAGSLSHVVDLEGAGASENENIDRYREISYLPEVNRAIEEIVSEAIVTDEMDYPVSLNLENLEVSDNIKQRMVEEFDSVLDLLDFGVKGHDIFSRWYIDGRVSYHKIIDEENPKKGIQELRYIDPKKIKKVREIKNRDENGMVRNSDIREYYVYNENGVDTKKASDINGVFYTKESIAHSNSGIFDHRTKAVLSQLHKALRPASNLSMLEDSAVIYRLSRAPERRVFYVDTGSLPSGKQDQYLRSFVNRYKSKMVYNADKGELKDQKKFKSMVEDYFIPRREGSTGTQVDTLQGGQQLGEMTDIEYFRDKLYQSLNVPKSRFSDESQMLGSRGTEITRDEIKFSRFIARLRTRFNALFYDLLGHQLVLKQVMSWDDWEKIRREVFFDYLRDNHFAEFTQADVMQNRIQLLRDAKEYQGTYFSKKWIQKNVLQMSDEEIDDMEKQMAAEPKPEGDEFGGF